LRSASHRSGWYALAFLSLGALAADQASKYAVEKYSSLDLHYTLIPGLLDLIHTSNPGVAFGLFADSQKPWLAPLLILFSAGVILLLGWLLATGRAGGWLGQCGLALILGGAAGNVLDRLVRSSVTDFIDFHLGRYHWYTFNVADSAIVIGAALVVLELLRDWRHPTQERA
jgi:signal peptidase II